MPEKGWQVERTDLGLRPTCSCENAETRPGVVLDPFGGSGTTSLVAKSLNRDSIYIDLNETYADMAVKRCDFNQQTLHIQHDYEVRKVGESAGREEAGMLCYLLDEVWHYPADPFIPLTTVADIERKLDEALRQKVEP